MITPTTKTALSGMINLEYIKRSNVIAAVRHLTTEWQEAAGETSLLDAYASVGHLLADILAGLELTSDELLEALGFPLYAEMGPAIRDSEFLYKRWKKNQNPHKLCAD